MLQVYALNARVALAVDQAHFLSAQTFSPYGEFHTFGNIDSSGGSGAVQMMPIFVGTQGSRVLIVKLLL